MEKTMNINIAGQLFRIDEEAFQSLSNYLEHVTNRFRAEPGGDETLSDIETRIAEIFGGGSEPPLLVSKEMVNNMINVMGAPEDYYDESNASRDETAYSRKSMYDPNRFSVRAGKALSAFRKVIGKFGSAVLRIPAVILGTLFTICGFILLFTSVILFFFNDAPWVTPLIEPDIINTHMLLSIVLNGQIVNTIWLLMAVVTLIPLASLSYLGIKLIFKIKKSPKPFRMAVFITWIAALCALGILLTLRLSIYSTHDRVEERIKLDALPKILWIAPLKKVSETAFDEMAAVEHFNFWKKSSTGQLFCSADLNVYGSDTNSGWISIGRRAFSNSESGAWSNAGKIGFGWKLSGDTLYLDEFFTSRG